jgi:hypothetical protein
MATTLTLINGPSISKNGATYIFNIALDTSFTAGGEVVDLTSYFKYIYTADAECNDTAADNQYEFGCMAPAAGTALTASNFKVTAVMTGATLSTDFDPADTVDMSGVASLRLVVTGAPAITTSWA